MSDEAQALIAQEVIDQASKLGLTVGCAESLTGGLVSSRLVEIPGASASAMAEGAVSRLGIDVAVATTGVAGPDPDPVSGEAPGTVFIAVAGGALGTLVRELSLEGDRSEIRERATKAALQALVDGLATRE